MNISKELIRQITKGIQDKKGSHIVVADLSDINDTICNYFIICQGNSPAQVEAITESIGDFARERLKEKPTHVVGLENAQWVAMDYTFSYLRFENSMTWNTFGQTQNWNMFLN